MLLALDVGNTNINLGLWENNRLKADWRLSTKKETTSDELGLLVGGLLNQKNIFLHEISGVIISSVVPPMRASLERFSLNYLKLSPLFVEPQKQKIMAIKYSDPKEVGADRIVVSIAAYERFKKSVVVVDFGTATTFDCISESGEYLGGAIAPGLKLSSDALFQKASRLPKIELFYAPEKTIAQDTISSLNSGLIYGYAGLVDGIVNRIKSEMQTEPIVVATGGLARIISKYTTNIGEVLSNLTLEGLKIIYEKKLQDTNMA